MPDELTEPITISQRGARAARCPVSVEPVAGAGVSVRITVGNGSRS